MESLRKPFQGVSNIIRFNWHFYVLSVLVIVILFGLNILTDYVYVLYLYLLGGGILMATGVSLFVSFYIYDLSSLYSLNWLDSLPLRINSDLVSSKIVNIHSGFDETSALLKAKYPSADLQVFDFYNPIKHTEVSIKRARKAFPAFINTIQIDTSTIPLPSKSVDQIFIIFSAHEIRNNSERIIFFRELNRILKPNGSILVTEHLRNIPNFLAYNIGYMHFLSLKTWLQTFEKANLKLISKTTYTPFITNCILVKNDDTH